jgi:hypothetical protein
MFFARHQLQLEWLKFALDRASWTWQAVPTPPQAQAQNKSSSIPNTFDPSAIIPLVNTSFRVSARLPANLAHLDYAAALSNFGAFFRTRL